MKTSTCKHISLAFEIIGNDSLETDETMSMLGEEIVKLYPSFVHPVYSQLDVYELPNLNHMILYHGLFLTKDGVLNPSELRGIFKDLETQVKEQLDKFLSSKELNYKNIEVK